MKCSFNKEDRMRFNAQEMHFSERRLQSDDYFNPKSEKVDRRDIEFSKRVTNLYNSLHQGITVTVNPTLEREFNVLAEKWEDETGLYSTIAPKVVNDTFIDLLILGRKNKDFVVSLILKRIMNGAPAQWHIVLKAVTKAQPVPDSDITNSRKIKEAWLAWGRSNHLI